MKKFKLIYCLFAFSLFIISCNNDDNDNLDGISFKQSEYDSDFNLKQGETLTLSPMVYNTSSKTNYAWYLNDNIISISKDLEYAFNKVGDFKLVFKVSHGRQEIERKYTISVKNNYESYFRPKSDDSSPYISEILAFKPAPGQFLNTSISNEDAAQSIIGVNNGMVSLGSWGGYIDFKFDHTIVNTIGERDFVIYGNAFNGSSEPGIVQVSFDENGNGVADDQWYEIAGSAHYKANTIFNYELTYYNPNDAIGIPLKDNTGTLDTLRTNTYHKQPYYPNFIEEQDSVTFKGTKLILPFTKNSNGWTVTENLLYGYADNYSEEFSGIKGNTIDISWAVDENLEPVKLQGVDFIRVYNGVFGQNSMLGEISTEIKGAADLSLLN